MTAPLSVLAICGSLRAVSSNKALLEAAARLAPEGMTIALFEDLAALPPFNPDDDVDPRPQAVAAWRARIKAADGLLISSPEYARGVAGSLKNALDWLVSDEDFHGKPVAIFNASPRASHALSSLRLILDTMSGQVCDAAALTVPLLSTPLDAAGIAAHPDLSRQVRDALTAFATDIRSRRQS